ncbi:hypothetical protein ACK3BE_32715 (plasmid) [Pseudomonas mandelii]|uniref:hypothetical protein n=1 Tax=Pseudomonas mandelii TaxID=75612 RepID=UPI00398D1F59
MSTIASQCPPRLFSHRKQQLFIPSLTYILGTAGMVAVFWFQKGQLDSTLPLIPFMFSILVQQIGAREDLAQKARLVNAITLTIFAMACEIFYQASIGTDIPTAYVLYPIMMAITIWAETACRWLDRAEQHNSNIVKVIAIAIFVTGIGIGIYAMYLKSI